jgi:hypothetical protein
MRFKPSAHTIFRNAGDELILVNVSTNRMFAANETASEVWAALVRGEDLSELKDRLLASTNAPEAPGHVEAFVEMLISEQLIEPA